MEPIISCQNLVKLYQRRKRSGSIYNPLKWFNFEKETKIGLDNLTFHIQKGEKIGLIGPNGAGKSTFVKLVTGIIKPTSGDVTIFGIDPFKNRKLCAQNYGVVFGNRQMLWPHVPVIESFKLAADIYKINKEDFEDRIAYFDKILDIQDLLHVAPRKLSFGQRMKCQIVYSLLHLPSVIILDEATIGLDIMVRHRIIELLNQMVEEEKLTLIITSHLIEDVEKLANRLILLNKGSIMYDGPKTEFVKEYGNNRTIKATFQEKLSLSQFQHSVFENAKIDENKNYILLLECSTSEVSTAIQELAKFDELEDITIGEPNLETILREVFEAELDEGTDNVEP